MLRSAAQQPIRGPVSQVPVLCMSQHLGSFSTTSVTDVATLQLITISFEPCQMANDARFLILSVLDRLGHQFASVLTFDTYPFFASLNSILNFLNDLNLFDFSTTVYNIIFQILSYLSQQKGFSKKFEPHMHH